MSKRLRIAILISKTRGYGQGMLRGVYAAVLERRDWVTRDGGPSKETLAALRQWRPDGIIGMLRVPHGPEPYLRLGVPVVSLLERIPGGAWIGVDDQAVGAQAAEHFLQRGFRRFAYLGVAGNSFSLLRQDGFLSALKRAGHGCECLSLRRTYLPRWEKTGSFQGQMEIGPWAGSLRPPVAVLAFNDPIGREIAEACLTAGLRVPEDVAIVGVDNDQLICGLSNPPLSSVLIPWEKIGFEGAGLLDRMLRGGSPPASPLVLSPGGVATRQSSDVLATEDAAVAAAGRFIRENYHRPIGVDDVAKAAGIARRTLELRFRRILGRGVLAETRRARLERAKELLAGSEMPVGQVARLSGFRSIYWLSAVFRKMTGFTPTAYRKQISVPGRHSLAARDWGE